MQRPRQNIQIRQNTSNGIPPKLEHHLGLLASPYELPRVEQRRLAHDAEVVEVALAGVDEGREGEAVEGAAETEFVAREEEELADADEAFAEVGFEDFGFAEVGGGGWFGFFVVYVFGGHI